MGLEDFSSPEPSLPIPRPRRPRPTPTPLPGRRERRRPRFPNEPLWPDKTNPNHEPNPFSPRWKPAPNPSSDIQEDIDHNRIAISRLVEDRSN